MRCLIGAVAMAAAFGVAPASAHDESKYPDLKGQWVSTDGNAPARWDPTKPPGRGQQAPLTALHSARNAAGDDRA